MFSNQLPFLRRPIASPAPTHMTKRPTRPREMKTKTEQNPGKFQWNSGDVVYQHFDGTPYTPEELAELIQTKNKLAEINVDLESVFKQSALAAIDSFEPDELAYLAATCKFESPFRDRVAFQIYKSLYRREFIVAREWNRVDIAILRDDTTPLCFVELKAAYDFDILSNNTWLSAALLKDQTKNVKLVSDTTSCFSFLIITHINGIVADKFCKVIKYSRSTNAAIKKINLTRTLYASRQWTRYEIFLVIELYLKRRRALGLPLEPTSVFMFG